jgi:hypothetical protein
VLEGELPHRIVPHVAGREPASGGEGRCGNQAVGLSEGPSSLGMPATPLAGLPALPLAERDDAKAGEEAAHLAVLGRAESSYRLLDVDGARARRVARIVKRSETLRGLRTSSQEIDEDGRVQQNGRHQPTRLSSARRCRRTHEAGSTSHS